MLKQKADLHFQNVFLILDLFVNHSKLIQIGLQNCLENCETYDELWNVTQREMNETGEGHNYVRILCGKLFIQWTKNYEDAFQFLEHLNNKYCLDGRNPNSYAGILWCFGKHDRPWMEREIFGKMRYMTSNSTGKKFDSKKYIDWTKTLKNKPKLPPTLNR